MNNVEITVDVTEGGLITSNVVQGVDITGEVAVGAKGDKGDPGDPGQSPVLVAGTGIDVDNTDPLAPEVALDSASQASLLLADSATQPGDLATVATTGDYDDLINKPTIPSTIVESVVAGTNVTVDNTDPANPVVSATGGGGGDVDSVNGQTGVVVLDADDIDDTSTTHKFTTSGDISKLAGIEDGADVTDATNVNAAGATMNTDTTLAGNGYFLDEDNMVSDDATKVPSQQSVKAYVDTSIGALPEFVEGTGIQITDLGGGVEEIAVDMTAFDTDDLAEGTTNLYSQWESYTDSSITFLQPQDSAQKLHVGTMTDFSPYAILGDSKAFFTTQADGGFFTQVVSGDPSSLNVGAMFASTRSRGTLNSPTAVVAGDGMLNITALGFGSSGNLALTASGKTLYTALAVKAGTVGATDVAQEVHLGIGVGGNGTIRFNSAGQIGLFEATPVSQSAGWAVTNVTSDKTFDANATTLNELADVVGTLINDLKTYGLLGA